MPPWRKDMGSVLHTQHVPWYTWLVNFMAGLLTCSYQLFVHTYMNVNLNAMLSTPPLPCSTDWSCQRQVNEKLTSPLLALLLHSWAFSSYMYTNLNITVQRRPAWHLWYACKHRSITGGCFRKQHQKLAVPNAVSYHPNHQDCQWHALVHGQKNNKLLYLAIKSVSYGLNQPTQQPKNCPRDKRKLWNFQMLHTPYTSKPDSWQAN